MTKRTSYMRHQNIKINWFNQLIIIEFDKRIESFSWIKFKNIGMAASAFAWTSTSCLISLLSTVFMWFGYLSFIIVKWK